MLGALLSSSLVIEVIFSWPGLGPLVYEAFAGRDTPLILGCVLVCCLLMTIVTVLADIVLFAADPRIRLRGLPE